MVDWSDSSPEEIVSLIRRRRRQLMVHRILYYVYDVNIIDDFTYDRWNAELNQLESQFPQIAESVEFNDISPNRTVGSSNITDYPLPIIRMAQWLKSNYATGQL